MKYTAATYRDKNTCASLNDAENQQRRMEPRIGRDDSPAIPDASGGAMRRGLKLATVVLLSISFGASVRQVASSPSFCRFLSYYGAVRKIEAPISFWERLAYSLALARASEAVQ